MPHSASKQTPGDPPKALITALHRVLRPLVRLLLAQHVTYPYLANLLKSVFVDVAERDFPVEGKRQTDSRISLLTGVHRKDVKRLREEGSSNEAAPATVSLGAQLVARWLGLPEYLDKDGRPRPLPRLRGDGPDASFESLVSSVSKDIRARAVLDEWLRLGVAHTDQDDRVWLNVDAFVPEKGFDEKCYYFGRNIGDHVAAGAHNVLGGTPPFLERSVYYDNLRPESVEELEQMARDLGMQVLHTVNRQALVLQKRDSGRPAAQQRMNFGLYFLSAGEEPARNGDRHED